MKMLNLFVELRVKNSVLISKCLIQAQNSHIDSQTSCNSLVFFYYLLTFHLLIFNFHLFPIHDHVPTCFHSQMTHHQTSDQPLVHVDAFPYVSARLTHNAQTIHAFTNFIRHSQKPIPSIRTYVHVSANPK